MARYSNLERLSEIAETNRKKDRVSAKSADLTAWTARDPFAPLALPCANGHQLVTVRLVRCRGAVALVG
jgi:hypothetical protein